MTDFYLVHVPFNETVLKPEERIACLNDTVIEDSKSGFLVWADNEILIPILEAIGR